jgi:hypothetical protein
LCRIPLEEDELQSKQFSENENEDCRMPRSPVALTSLPCLADEPHQHEHGSPPERLGKVDFSVSCSASTREQFQRGVALLHSFWYDAAEKTFLEVARADPGCAMAYWGVAMTKVTIRRNQDFRARPGAPRAS